MSMLSMQADELRDKAKLLRAHADGLFAPFVVPSTKELMALTMLDSASRMEEAADTIESLRGRLQDADVAYNGAEVLGDVTQGLFHDLMAADPDTAKIWARSLPELFESAPENRWHQLFGTPERAARYFAMQCFGSDGSMCYYCPFDDCDENLRNSGTYPFVHDKLLKWLKGTSDGE